jgi:hypothetical protein
LREPLSSLSNVKRPIPMSNVPVKSFIGELLLGVV